jgi:flavin reductase (NADH)/cob(II)yrinic acid a,c-diamide reductase
MSEKNEVARDEKSAAAVEPDDAVAMEQTACCPSDDFKAGMRQLPGAVCVVGAAHEGARRGLTLTAICSVSIDPPSLLVCVNRNASAHDLIALSGCFAVNQLSTEHMAEARVFSGQCGIDGDLRFAAERWGVLKTGAPVLNDAVAVFGCQVIDSVATKTHTVFVASVVAARLDPSREPLIYLRSRYAKALAA